ncbi:hypothetical protein [Cerasicoccus frondis]|uniref:hypothetical protein n=1 Tax=Cerasicoccus frondis TaxID=490090 RepID=UPI002852D416|nr:hypothetical protein [Cerasicoccus frondis]
MKLRLAGLLAIIAVLTGCSATVPIRPYMFIQKEEAPNAPHAEAPTNVEDRVS